MISDHFATHFAVSNTVNSEGGGSTTWPTRPAAESFRAGFSPETRGTVFTGVCHVQLGHSHPSRGGSAGTWRRHVAVLHGGIACGGALDPVVSRGIGGGDVLAGGSWVQE